MSEVEMSRELLTISQCPAKVDCFEAPDTKLPFELSVPPDYECQSIAILEDDNELDRFGCGDYLVDPGPPARYEYPLCQLGLSGTFTIKVQALLIQTAEPFDTCPNVEFISGPGSGQQSGA